MHITANPIQPNNSIIASFLSQCSALLHACIRHFEHDVLYAPPHHTHSITFTLQRKAHTMHKLLLTLRCTQLSLTLRYTSSHSLYDAFSSHSHYDTQALTHTAMHSALTHFAMHKLSSHAHNDAPLNISEERAQHSSLAYQHKPQHMQAGRALLNRA
jgi:hypothetical protein